MAEKMAVGRLVVGAEVARVGGVMAVATADATAAAATEATCNVHRSLSSLYQCHIELAPQTYL